jgi:biotin carboxyl carrier protein
MRTVLLSCFVASLTPLNAAAKPRSMMMEFRNVPASPKAMAKVLATEKPGAFRSKVIDALETKLREKGEPLDDPDAIDAMTGVMFEHIFEDMAAANDVWVWEANESPRGDVLIRGTVKLLPGQNSTGFRKSVTVSPRGKRIDRGYLNTPCTVEVSVAKSPAEWHAEVEKHGRWVAALHPVKQLEGVARVAVSLFSPGKGEPPAPRHERPVWIAFFQQPAPGAPWELMWFDPAVAKEQKLQEANLLPGDGQAKLSDAQKQLVLALRMEDVRLINPDRKTLSKDELKWVTLEGLSGPVVDAKHVACDSPMVRAVAVLRTAQLGGEVKVADVVGIIETVKAVPVQAEAMGLLAKLVAAHPEPVSEADRAALAKDRADEVQISGDVARVRRGSQDTFFKRGSAGWELIKPAM